MKLGEKIRYLREVEGSLRGMDRAMSQQELVRAIDAETGSKLSQSYLSQIESGARPHLTNTTRQILAGFFKVHPGYLVDDPEGYSPELQSDLRHVEDKLDLWLVSGAVFSVAGATGWMRAIMMVNPLTYSLGLLRQQLTPALAAGSPAATTSLAVTAGFSVVLLAASAWMAAQKSSRNAG